MAKKKNYYAVAVGRETGIFKSWPETEALVKGFPRARFKGFVSRAEAEAWLEVPVYSKKKTGRKESEKKRTREEVGTDEWPVSEILIYTDGGAIHNPGPGGYGIVLLDGKGRREFFGGFRMTTNNRMELMACIVALEQLGQTDKTITLYSDSKYVVNGISKGWAKNWRKRGWMRTKKEEAANKDLWARLLDGIAGLNIRFQWVKGHAGHLLNERCDQLASRAARRKDLPVDPGFPLI